MAKLKVEQFVDLVKRSGLVDDERLNEALSGVDQSVKDSGIVASCLTKAGLLTEWQSEKLLQGRHKGFHLGKYKLLNHIGTGGMGSVYLAEHQVMRHRVAIKLLPHNLASQNSYIERFHQEARAAANLVHSNIIRAFDVDQHENFHYLVMEFVDGTDIQGIVSRSGPLPYETAANYTRQAAEGLSYAHRMGLIHRDIKPANLLVDKAGLVKILDMGLARFTDDSQGSLTKEYDQKMIGTVDYLAPEQAIDSHKVDGRADIYSLGCTLYFMLTGDAPFPQGTIPQRLMQHQSAEPADIRNVRPDAPQALIDICRKMMAKSLDDRFQSGDEVAQALSAWLGYDSSGTLLTNDALMPPPAGPSLNENLDLAPLEEEASGREKRAARDSQAGSKPASDVTNGSAVGKAGNKSGGHSVVTGPAASGAKGPGSGVKGQGSGVRGGNRPGSKSGVKSPSGIGGKPSKPAPTVELGGPSPTIDLSDELVDELLAAPALPPSEQHLSTAPLGGAGRSHEDSLAVRLGKVVGVGVGGAVAVVLLIILLIYVWTNF